MTAYTAGMIAAELKRRGVTLGKLDLRSANPAEHIRISGIEVKKLSAVKGKPVGLEYCDWETTPAEYLEGTAEERADRWQAKREAAITEAATALGAMGFRLEKVLVGSKQKFTGFWAILPK
jgi:hypothetical protein